MIPLGCWVEERKLAIVPEEAEVVHRIFERFLETQSPKLIAMDLNGSVIHLFSKASATFMTNLSMGKLSSELQTSKFMLVFHCV
jgi:hypothetical protein